MATIADLNVKIGVDGVPALDAGLKQASKSVGELGRETDKAADKIEKASANSSKGFSAINRGLSGLSGAIAGAFTVGAVLQFGSAVIETAANFQKMEAVLTNTLGSSSAAQGAMLMIQDIAAKTPYSVEQLTASFVKLANRGIKPTGDEIIKLADLAAASGKDFDQLSEGLLDAMTGEFERLKEFGVIASSQGDKVAFTFKGVTTEVAKTDTAIKDYIISLGSLEGVAGSTAAISETLGGQISNLGDSFTSLFKVIGEGSSGILSASVKGLNAYVSELANALKSADQLRAEEISKRGAFLKEGIGNPKTAEEFAAAQAKLNSEIAHNIELQGKVKAKIEEIKKSSDEAGIINLTGRNFNKEIQEQRGLIDTFQRRVDAAKQALLGLAEAQKVANNPAKEQIPLLEKLNAQLKEQEAIKAKATNDKEILLANQRIAKIQEEIKRLNELGTAKAKAGAQTGLSPIAAPDFSKVKENQDFGSLPDSSDYDSITNGINQQNAALAEQHRLLGLMPPAYMALGTATEGVNNSLGLSSLAFEEFAEAVRASIEAGVEDMVAGFGEMAAAAATGASGFTNLASMVLMPLADMAVRVGKIAIGVGIGVEGIKKALETLNPVAAVAAGVALVALGSIAKGALSKAASGGGVSMPSGGGSYSAPTNRARTDAFSGPGASGNKEVSFKIKGTDLEGVLRQQGYKNGR